MRCRKPVTSQRLRLPLDLIFGGFEPESPSRPRGTFRRRSQSSGLRRYPQVPMYSPRSSASISTGGLVNPSFLAKASRLQPWRLLTLTGLFEEFGDRRRSVGKVNRFHSSNSSPWIKSSFPSLYPIATTLTTWSSGTPPGRQRLRSWQRNRAREKGSGGDSPGRPHIDHDHNRHSTDSASPLAYLPHHARPAAAGSAAIPDGSACTNSTPAGRFASARSTRCRWWVKKRTWVCCDSSATARSAARAR